MATIKGENMQERFTPLIENKDLFDSNGLYNDFKLTAVINNETLYIKPNDIKLSYVNEKGDCRMNKFLEIKEGQEIDKINNKYFEERKLIVMNDKIYKILLKAEQEINDIYKEEDAPSRVDISYLNYVTNENSLKIDKLKQDKDEKIKEVKRKYAEIAALVEDIPAADRIEIYKEYGIM